ncbi:MAG: xylulokinase, partial [Candidatus Aminicenantes bacterium]|nr:xylulokinase [Candidatus Aminicenantes bacterium]
MMFAVGVDSGTQSTKVFIIDFEGNVQGRGSAPHTMLPKTSPGSSEQDPAVWIEAFCTAFRQALEDASENRDFFPKDIVCLGVSGQQHGCVPLDKSGIPIRPAKLWNDTSTVRETKELVHKLGGPKEYINKLGIGLAVGFTASKILWLKKNEPDNFKRLHTVLLPHNYLNFILTGNRHMEYGDASGTGLMDIRSRQWNEDAVGAIGDELFNKLPPLTHPREPAGYLLRLIADRFGLNKVLVGSGGGDNMMGAIGTGNTHPGVCTLSLGTSGTIYSYFDEVFSDPEGEIAAFCDSTGGWLPLLCTMNVTNTTEHLKSLLRLSNEDLEMAASLSPSGADGLLFLPFMSGERVPGLPDARGVLFGMTGHNLTASHLSRAFMEGTILNLGYGFNRMRSLGLHPTEIRATGGGAYSRTWLQITADIFRTPVVTLHESEAAAFGAAIQSIWNWYHTNGETIDISELTDRCVKLTPKRIEPDPGTESL